MLKFYFWSLVFIFLAFPELAFTNNLLFVDNSVTNDTYIPSNKKKQVELAFRMASSLLKTRFPSCKLNTQEIVGRSNPLFLMEQAKVIPKKYGERTFLIGMIHSSEALLGAKAFKNENILALSSGAATNILNKQNPNFFSLANSASRVSKHLQSYIIKKSVTKVLAIIPGNSSYSIELANNLEKILHASNMSLKIIHIDLLDKESVSSGVSRSKDYELIYVPGFLQQTLPIFEALAKVKYTGIIYGSANLARSKPDLHTFSKAMNLTNSNVVFPATWLSGESDNSKILEEQFLFAHKEEIMGTAVYTYDAAIVAGTYLCSVKDFSSSSFETFVKNNINKELSSTSRRYLGLDEGHFVSSITTVRYDIKTQRFIKEFSE